MKRHTRTTIAALIAVVGLLATVVPASALGFLLPTRFSMKKIETLASYDPQSSCQPSAKIGTRSLLAYLEKKYPGTGSSGISRACGIGGRSEHKEGRALDWKVNYNNPRERAQAEHFVNWLLKRDKMGRKFANARRLGVMYFIWDGRIWSASDRSFRTYTGASSHRDHVHISLSWAGAKGKTSFWTGEVARNITPVLPIVESKGKRGKKAQGGSDGAAAPTPTPTVSSDAAVTSGHDHAEEERSEEVLPSTAPSQEDSIVWYWDRYNK